MAAPFEQSPSVSSDIAVVGISCRVPGANSPAEFWSLLRDGREALTVLTDEQLRTSGVPERLIGDPNYVKAGMFLQQMEEFDPGFFGFSPLDGRVLDPQHRHFLECVWEALENAACDPGRHAGSIGVFAGAGHHSYLATHLLTNPQLVNDVGMFLLRHTGNDKDFLATRASYCFDLKGPSVNVQTACSTSLVAVHLGMQSLLNGECDMVVAGGVTIELPHRQGYLYKAGEILSRDGHCRPFDISAGGTVFGSGVGVVVLKRLDAALAEGYHVHAVIRASAVNNDGAGKVSYLAPSVDGQAASVGEALAVADIDPRSVSYIETHGTGTPLGDPIEVAALTQAYGGTNALPGSCALGSVKSNIGHLDTAAGIASLIKVVLALQHRQLPPTLHFTAPNPAIDFPSSPFVVNDALTPWQGPRPLRAGVSSLGVGGTNAHLILEEAPARTTRPSGRALQLLLTSARSASSLRRFHDRLARAFDDGWSSNEVTDLADAAYTLAVGRRAFRKRAFLVAATNDDAMNALEAADASCVVGGTAPASDRDVAFMFAGGGAQYSGMGRGLYETEPIYRGAVDECLDVLSRLVDFDLEMLLYPPDTADLAEATRALERPSRALPALFTTQYAQAQLWRSWGVEPTALIGHSMGENTAACLAGVMSLRDTLGLVTLRGRLFETVEPGGMISIDLDEAGLRDVLTPDLSLAAINAPGLGVVSGPLAPLARLEQVLTARQIGYQRVHIDVAAHSSMLEGILAPFGDYLRSIELHAPRIPFVSNLTGDWITADEATSPDYWVGQLRHTVRFADGVGRLLTERRVVLLEVGPGRTLSTLAGLHIGKAPDQTIVTSMRHRDDRASDLGHMLSALGKVWLGGGQPDWTRFYQGQDRVRVPLPTYAFDHVRCWTDAGTQVAFGVSDGQTRRTALDQWLYQPVWQRTADRPEGAASGLRVLVLATSHPLAERTIASLTQAGADVRVVREGDRLELADLTSPRIRLQEPDDYLRVVDALESTGWVPTHVLHLLALETAESAEFSRVARARAFDSLFHLAQAAGNNAWTLRWVVAGPQALQVGGERPLGPLAALALGPVKVLPHEFEGWTATYVDVEVSPGVDLSATARSLVGELTATPDADGGTVVALRGGARYLQRFVARAERPADIATNLPVARAGGVYLVTGGTGGLGLAAARALADQAPIVLVLLSRRPLPARDHWSTFIERAAPEASLLQSLLDLETRGARVVLAAADVADRAAMVALKLRIAELGTLRGIVHTAGVVDDGLVLTKDIARCHAVLAPKLAGTLALDEVFAAPSLDFFALYSSSSALAGLAGQIDYAAANAFLDALAHWRAADGVPYVSINWPAWRGTGMAARLAEGGTRDRRFEAGRPTDHPLLDRCTDEREDGAAYATAFTVARHWVLSEHRIKDGPALLPGAGFLEVARAAWAERDAYAGPLTITDAVFEFPFIVEASEQKVLRVALTRRGNDTAFALTSAVADIVTEHAHGRIARSEAPAGRLDLAGIRQRCTATRQRFTDPDHHPFLTFGSRWEALQDIAYGQGEALIELAVSHSHLADVETLPLHPALLDMATAGAQKIIDGYVPADDFYVPVGYGQLVFSGRFPDRAFSHVVRTSRGSTSRDRVTFDITASDQAGRVFLTVRDFVMQRVSGAHVFVRAGQAVERTDHDAVARALELGIEPAEGQAVLTAVLARGLGPQTVVSPHDLHEMLRALRPTAPPVASAPPPFDPDDDPAIDAVEAAFRDCPAVASAAVRSFRGEGEARRLVVYFVPNHDVFVTLSEVRKFARTKLPSDRLPQQYVELDEWPTDPSGVVNREALGDPLAPEDRYVAPRTTTEKALARLWQDALGVERVGLRDNFFDLGGHSLLSVRVIVQVSKKLGVRLDQATMVLGTLEQVSRGIDDAHVPEPLGSDPATAPPSSPQVEPAKGGAGLLHSIFGRKGKDGVR